MDGVAVRDVGFRRRLFEETGSRMNLDPLIVEKDFWVCWTLNRLFNLPDLRKQLVFRGGTSLSKVYRVIHRFSEDIDLTMKKEFLGFEGDNDLAMLAKSRFRDNALQDYDLLDAVAQHKKLFFRCAWAKYEEARPGTLRLIPPDFRLPELKKDYDKMQIMMFDKPPSFKEIMDIILELESNINNR